MSEGVVTEGLLHFDGDARLDEFVQISWHNVAKGSDSHDAFRSRSVTDVTPWLALLVPAYVVGTFPTAQIMTRRAGIDVMTAGSGNPGASNTFRTAGRKAGTVVLVVDILKGVLPTIAGLIAAGRPLAMVCGIAAFVGHSWPVQRHLKGGKGVATAGGLAFGLYPFVAVGLIILWVVLTKITHKASIGSLAIVTLLPVGVAITHHRAWETTAIVALSVIVIARHTENIKRLVSRTERNIARI